MNTHTISNVSRSSPFFFAVVLLAAGLMTATVSADGGGTIVINVKAQGGDDTFSFSGDLGDFEVTSDDGEGKHILDDLVPGEYVVTGKAPKDWNEFGIMCPSSSIDIDFDTFTVRYQLAVGESISCTYIFRYE